MVIAGCGTPNPVTNREDYEEFLKSGNIVLTSGNEIDFWSDRFSKVSDDNISLLKLASLFAEKFKATGDVDFILRSDSLYHVVLSKPVSDKAFIHQALATNAISQHKFRLAQKHIAQALAIGDHQATSKLILADVEMELGGYELAAKILRSFKNKNSFAWLIRKAKLKDHEGNLDSAITLMEHGYERIKGNIALATWTLTNLGDMYGHDGRIQDAYKSYLKVLELDPTNDYSLRGIAWIAISNDHNLNDARAIINFLSERKRMPEAHLMLAEIALLEHNEAERMRQLKLFKDMVDNPSYRLMYNQYLADIEATDFKNPQRCITLAKEEISNRPTPQSYDLLAWGYFMNGDNDSALQVVNEHVFGNTFEPKSLYHMGLIYKSNGFLNEGNEMLEEALQSSFELGPSVTNSIQLALK